MGREEKWLSTQEERDSDPVTLNTASTKRDETKVAVTNSTVPVTAIAPVTSISFEFPRKTTLFARVQAGKELGPPSEIVTLAKACPATNAVSRER
jgi:hypothetical protein